MKMDDTGWEESLKASPFSRPQFGDEHKRRIRARLGGKGAPQRHRRGAAIACLAAALLLVLGLWYVPGLMDRSASPIELEGPRQAYYDGEELLLEVFPDPELKAGKEYGYIFHFAKLQREVEGKEFAIDIVHLETGRRFSAVKPFVVEVQNLAELQFERYIVRCVLPIGGLWRYEVKLDGKPYADVVLDVGEADWTPSPTFHSGSYEMTGVEGKIGFIDPGFIAGRTNKYMWHIWGAPSETEGEFQVMAVKQGTTELIPVLKGLSFGGPLNGADGSVPSSMMLPEPGLWRLLPMVGGRLLDSIVVQVKPQVRDDSLADEAGAVTTEQLKRVKPEMTYAEVIEVIGDSADIGSGRYIKTYRHTGGMTFTLNYGSPHEILWPDVYLIIQEILKSEAD